MYRYHLFLKMLLAVFSVLIMSESGAQDSLGINYQGIARSSSGNILSNQNISLRFRIYSGSVSGQPLWEETHTLVTGTNGVFSLEIGNGTNTGNGSEANFYSINWSTMNHVMEIAMDENGGSVFTVMDTIAFRAVPYAYYAVNSGNVTSLPYLSQLNDVDTSSLQTGNVLKWNGVEWIPAPDMDSDTAAFAYSGNYAAYSDTAAVAYNVINIPDSSLYSDYCDTSVFSVSSLSAANADHADDADTALFAWNCMSAPGPSWGINGNSGTNPATEFLGTTDNSDLVIKTNGIERMRIKADGKIGVGTSVPMGAFHINSSEGFYATGNFGNGSIIPVTGAGTRMFWYPKRAAFRAGTVSGAQFDDLNIGNYSFASGYNCVARGNYSFAAGESSTVYSDNSAALGYGNIASGNTSFAAGSANTASGIYSIALGRGCQASDSNSVAIGYHSNAFGKFALAFGFQNTASGDYSITMGYHTNTSNKSGSFVFADGSSATYTNATADNQFMIRASGGYWLYSNSTLTTGVTLAAGSGSWSTLSDKNSKKNIRKIEEEEILKKLDELEVYSWSYISQPDEIRHIGPMAQDFSATFGYGENDKTISMVDIDGVNMSALKALEKKTSELNEKTKELEKMKTELEMLKKEKQEIENRVEKLEKLMGN